MQFYAAEFCGQDVVKMFTVNQQKQKKKQDVRQTELERREKGTKREVRWCNPVKQDRNLEQ